MLTIQISVLGMSLLYLLVITFMFFSKKRVNNDDTNIYKYMLIVNILAIFTEFSLYAIADAVPVMEGTRLFIFLMLSKVFVCLILLWFILIMIYTTLICDAASKKKYLETRQKTKLAYKVFTGALIEMTIVLLSPVEFVYADTSGYTTGPATKIAFLFIIAACFTIVFYLIKNWKAVHNKKIIPIVLLLILMIATTLIQATNPQLLLFNPVITLIAIIMFHTIENPDTKIIEQLNMARDQADKANKAKTEFLSNMSHEIRTPLNAIVGFSNLLLENKDIPEEAKDEIKDIIMAGDNLLEIVNDILDISKIEANKMEIEAGEYSFKKLANELVTLTKGRIAEKPLEFKVSIDETIPPVLYGDAQKVKQVCVNILTNAVKYTKEGWIELKINHVAKDGVCRLIISVEDTGIGIKEGNIDRLFNKFDRLDVRDNITIEGTGLGLAITKKLLDLMGGKIVVQSVYGKGSKFTVSLDQKIVENPTIKVEEESIEDEKVQLSHEKMVLIVDDNKINLKVAERLLDSYDIKSVSVDNGHDAIEKIKNGEKFDLILMDDMMPKLSGVETFHMLQALEGFKTPTIALTANAITGMREKYLDEGFSDYLAKPINKEELNRIINTYLNKE